jgi:TRAP transporter TAXI family solute receptor
MRIGRSATIALAVGVVLAVAVAVVLVVIHRPRPPGIAHLVIAAGPAGEVNHALGQALADAARQRWATATEVLTTAGGVANLKLVGDGKADVAFADADAAEPFESDGVRIAALARLYDDYVHLVVSAKSTYTTVADLKDTTVSVGTRESGTDIAAGRILDAANIRGTVDERRNLSDVDAAKALEHEQIAAFAINGGLPTPLLVDLARRFPIRVLPIPGEVAELQDRFGEVYLDRSIPANTYGNRAEVPTVGIPTLLVVRQDLPEDTAFQLTELLFAARSRLIQAHPEARRLDPQSAPATYPVPLHEGAKAYYRRVKPMALVQLIDN